MERKATPEGVVHHRQGAIRGVHQPKNIQFGGTEKSCSSGREYTSGNAYSSPRLSLSIKSISSPRILDRLPLLISSITKTYGLSGSASASFAKSKKIPSRLTKPPLSLGRYP